MSQEFADQILALASQPREPFTPEAHYVQSGDCVEFLTSDEPFYSERIDSLVTVYYSQESNQIIGALVKGFVAKIMPWLKERPGVKIELEDGQLKLSLLFYCKQLEAGDQIVAQRYRKLREIAEKTNVAVELCGV